MRRSSPSCCALLFLVSQPVLPAGPETRAVGDHAEADRASIRLTKVTAWCDHMPGFGKPGGRQHLIASTTFKNKTAQPLTVTLVRAYVSFDPGREGDRVRGLALRGPDGTPGGKTSVTLDAGAEVKVEFGGVGLFPEGRHDRPLYLTLSFAAGKAPLVVRGSGRVGGTS
ncbi:MAG: hypothetical protein HY906_01490 [Deltaproteobacteria bacterium]|nr:hypothetical protein [Deltaproteobacteria bacterium]